MFSKRPLFAFTGTAVIASLAFSAYAQTSTTMQHTDGMSHEAMQALERGPTEPGQGAFAAISEIVAMLAANPNTDWASVDIDMLREHLVDMDMLVSNADVSSKDVPGGVELTVLTTGLGGGAVSRMVPAHTPFLVAETGWDATLEDTGGALVWTVTSEASTDQIRALGFFGLMSTGFHHSEHHLGMATGAMVHN